MKKGLLLVNLGTPDQPTSSAVRRYLREFLSDKRVINLPAILRYPLVYGIILPFRPKKSAKAYRAIWSENGSPLLLHSGNLQKSLQENLGNEWQVALGMRYGNPSINAALQTLMHCDSLTILPLFPQYSSAATGSAIEKTLKCLGSTISFPSFNVIREFYQQPAFIMAQAALIKPYLDKFDHILFSYHGIPEYHLSLAGCKNICQNHCPHISSKNCYRAQCFATSHLLAETLSLSPQQYSVAFQSRLGRTPWIKPYLDQILPDLITAGIKKLAIACPSFVTDCLETLEEIGIRAQEQWVKLGGEKLILIPCLNDDALWARNLSQFINEISSATP